MPLLRLPRTHGCLACGRDNPHGISLELSVDPSTGEVSAEFSLPHRFIGFTDVIHGGVIATIVDEAMVWAATWAGKRFCLCGELITRFLQPARPGVAYRVEAKVEAKRSRLISTTARVLDASGSEIATASAKYLPIPLAQHAKVVETFIDEPTTRESAKLLS